MRALVIVVTLSGLATVAAAGPKPKPCPKDLATKLVGEYARQPDPSQIKLSACVWGNFDGPGWIVYHVVPWPKGSKAEVGPDGGRVFVREDGTIAATDF